MAGNEKDDEEKIFMNEDTKQALREAMKEGGTGVQPMMDTFAYFGRRCSMYYKDHHRDRTKAHVDIHPDDDTLPTAFYVDPDYFVAAIPPNCEPRSRFCHPWGLPLHNDEYFSLHKRMMKAQSWYRNKDSPEVQFCKILAEKKIKALMAGRKCERDLVLDVELDAVTPRIWRRVRVSAKTNLNVLVDKVLLPLMGFERNYHGWLVMDRRDHSLFGQAKGANSIDLCHMFMHSFYAIDSEASKITLGHLLQRRGDEIGWLYDLGDNWTHTVTVVEVCSAAESSGKVKCLDGAMQCPPEDSNGLENKGNESLQEFLDLLKKTPKTAKARAGIAEMRTSSNLNTPGLKVDPFRFCVDEAQARIEAAIRSKASVNSGSKHNIHVIDPAGSDKLAAAQKLAPGQRRTRVAADPGEQVFRTGPGINETVATGRDPKDAALCHHCGAPDATALCGGCRAIRYCSRDCQKKDWRRAHKRECAGMKAQQDDVRREVRTAAAAAAAQ